VTLDARCDILVVFPKNFPRFFSVAKLKYTEEEEKGVQQYLCASRGRIKWTRVKENEKRQCEFRLKDNAIIYG
jgi:hypothetical protein